MTTRTKNILGWLLGALFGFLMSRAGATTYDYHAKMFLFQDFQLMEVIGVAVLIGMAGIWWMQSRHMLSLSGDPIQFPRKPWNDTLVLGAFLFGIGWAMTASCPGTVPAMLGEGKLPALFVLLGIVLGTFAYGVLQDARLSCRRD
ncbi:hypothetical protein SAMN05443662_0100 [Sulfurivirga caldicuralii]|uniref:Uncharacterized protein n=1 Tax=Sulfurivirga caldicuralii TaxID=364032 RepID=A0A1N6DF87_9GAMM|nr:DUF6691 family protein [Sulfurivirga caldicuralii]SIN69462.1 hypothetical protein SAMN05443662_0100 [Sulfurivirga caldicuralii]